MKEFKEELQLLIDEKLVMIDENMSRHTTFRVGGAADCLVQADGVEAIQSVCSLCKQHDIPYYVIGNGSNLLVGDKGFRGVIIEICNKMNEVRCEGNMVIAQAGALLSKVAKVALEHELAGFEFAAGIPGTLGGAVVMNAGAYGGEMKDVMQSITVLNQQGEIEEIAAEQLELGYRTSNIEKNQHIVLEVKLELVQGDRVSIQKQMDELKVQRVTKQPLEYPSGGSTFKRPEGYFAAKLIDDAGLCGFQVGGAQVSEKHCGFVINKESATASDIVELMRQVAKRVEEQYRVTLEPEIKRIGEF